MSCLFRSTQRVSPQILFPCGSGVGPQPLAHMLSIGEARWDCSPHPLMLDRSWRRLISGLSGLGPVAACLRPGRFDAVCLASPAALKARAPRLAAMAQLAPRVCLSPLADSRALRAAVSHTEHVSDLTGAATAGAAASRRNTSSWRWSTAWERAGLREMASSGATDLQTLLPQGGPRHQVNLAAVREEPSEGIELIAKAAALAAGLHPTELRERGDVAVLRVRKQALGLAQLRGWTLQAASRGLGLRVPPTTTPTHTGAQLHALAAPRRTLSWLLA